MLINDRLSTILTQHAGEMAFVQRSHYLIQGMSVCLGSDRSETS